MADKSEVLQKLQEYAARTVGTEYLDSLATGEPAYHARLERDANELSKRVETARHALDSLQVQCVKGGFDVPSSETRIRLQQLRAIKIAFEKSTAEVPDLPNPESTLPALLALRGISRLVLETRDSVPLSYGELAKARESLSTEELHLQSSNLLTTALENRITRLRDEVAVRSQRSPQEANQAHIAAQQAIKIKYDKQTKKLTRSLVVFINQRLAPMLAAEELGGPVVGDLLEVPDELLSAGFTAKGRAKKAKEPIGSVAIDQRQRRIDQIWGHNANEDVNSSRSEREAAAQEMRELIEELLNLAIEQGPGAYMMLERDSAAARFLVRAKVALLHPKDARKLRLIDFDQEMSS